MAQSWRISNSGDFSPSAQPNHGPAIPIRDTEMKGDLSLGIRCEFGKPSLSVGLNKLSHKSEEKPPSYKRLNR